MMIRIIFQDNCELYTAVEIKVYNNDEIFLNQAITGYLIDDYMVAL